MEASCANSSDQKQTPNVLVEVNNIEKELWTLIHSKTILHPHVSELYTKANLTYHQIFQSPNLQQQELQEVEFSLWKLHYKHIDEFRKGIKTDAYMKALKLFLLKASEFYQNLISIVSEESSRFLCHRFYICLGDLERYKEQYVKSEKHPNWSTAATYYLESARSWPDSGNPHNQLAVLATYVGDEFLALYHCVRSLAVKEPFPGASNNLLLLFDKNRSSPLESLSTNAEFNFSNPSERHVRERNVGQDRDLWALVVRLTGFFFLKSSFDEFGCTFASTMRALDEAFAADDTNLEAMLESYRILDTKRKGPYRILQLVAVFIFVLANAEEEVKVANFAFRMAFVVMGRVVERCLKTNPLDSCPLLPGLVVFLDYLPSLLHRAERDSMIDEESEIAISYFFGNLVDLLNRLKLKDDAKLVVALWEDHELRSLAPLDPLHVRFDFSSRVDLRESFVKGKELRLQRIFNSAIEISSIQKWLFFDKQRTRFYTSSGESQYKEETFRGEISPSNERSVLVEEEEVILLKPLVRCQSAPIYSPGIATDNNEETSSRNQTASSDESLRRASSLVNHTDSGSFSFTQGLKEMELEEGAVSGGRPPSLSAWVVDKNKEKARSKPKGLSPIDETGPITSFDSIITISGGNASSSYSPPAPSAPLLPEDASWFDNGDSTNKSERVVYDQGRFVKPFVGMSSSEWLRQYRESQNLGGTNNNGRKFDNRGFQRSSLLARYGTPSEQPTISSENSVFYYPRIDNDESRGGNNEQRGTNGYGMSEDPGPFLQYLREKENGQRLREPSRAYMNN